VLFELSVIPLGGDKHLSDELAPVLSLIDRSGLPYQLGPGSTCIEGDWDEAMELIRAVENKAGQPLETCADAEPARSQEK